MSSCSNAASGRVRKVSRQCSNHARPRRGRLVSANCTSLNVDGRTPTEPAAWMEMMQTLKSNNVTFVNPHEVPICQEKGIPVLDVRTVEQYEKGFIQGSINVPLYQPIEGWDAYKVARRIGYALFGVLKGTEPNPNFMQEVSASLEEKDMGVVVCCAIGGTLEPQEGVTAIGIQSRSLVAAYQLVKAGYTGIRVLKNGMGAWVQDGREVYTYEEEEE